MAYASTIIIHGHGKAVATSIAANTEIGKIATLVRDVKEEKTPLQLRLEKLSKMFGALFIAICIFIIGIGLIQERDFFEMLETGVAVGVASIPEGLTIAITFILALGMQKILKKKALIRKLVATETLGSVTVICTDKTGTLTKGEMSVDHIVVGEKEFEMGSSGSRQNKAEAKIVSLALQTAIMCNDATIENPDQALRDWKFIGAPTEVALLRAATESGLRQEELLKSEPQIAELPFDSEKKYMLSLHALHDGSYILYEKGAPEALLEKASHYYHQGSLQILGAKEKHRLIKNYEKMTAKGFRVIGLAIKNFGHQENNLNGEKVDWSMIDTNLHFIGL
jgi:Ca2+-transporting ATPase